MAVMIGCSVAGLRLRAASGWRAVVGVAVDSGLLGWWWWQSCPCRLSVAVLAAAQECCPARYGWRAGGRLARCCCSMRRGRDGVLLLLARALLPARRLSVVALLRSLCRWRFGLKIFSRLLLPLLQRVRTACP